jgi:protein TonB
MPSTAKDALSETMATDVAQESQPGNAVGAELPVTIHASRYSAASQAAGKLPPVHEDTRTVIIFPQGAVVRLSATVTLGELVVLTNQRTGADVICRVKSVKTQPGIQNYVHLEFTQRALDFWEETSAADRGSSAAKGPLAASPVLPLSAPAAATPIASAGRPPSPLPNVQSVAKTVAAVEVKSTFTPAPKITPLADIPVEDSEELPEKATDVASQVSESAAAPAPAPKRPHIMPSRVPRFHTFEPVLAQKSSSSKTVVVFAIAAVALLAIGAVGGAVLLRRDRSVNVAEQRANPAVATPTGRSPVTSLPGAPNVNSSVKAGSLEPVSSAPAKRISVKSAPAETPAPAAPIPAAVEAPKKEVPPSTQVQTQPQPHVPPPVNRPAVNVSKISPPKMKTAAQLNSSEPPPVLPVTTNVFPAAIVGESAASTPARSNPLPSVEPVAPPPVKGGQLQQPKLVSSVAAVYPPLARSQHVQGDVTIDALIDANGKVADTKVVSGSPILQKAAVDSVRLWKYEPARLNGEPIPIHTKVTVSFHRE